VGVIFDYFAAPDVTAAAAVLEHGPDDAVAAGGVDPAVLLGHLDELLGGRPLDEQLEDPQSARLVEQRQEGVARELCALARRAEAAGRGMYCWVCV
jgi:hypothetical protein